VAELHAKVTFLGDVKDLLKKIRQGKVGLNDMGKAVQQHSRQFMMAGAAIGGALGGLAKQGIAWGTTVDRMAESTGQAHEEMSRLAYSAELYHGSAQKVEKGLRNLAQKAMYAKDGMATYRREFERAGVDIEEWTRNGAHLNDLLLELADSYAKNEDGAEALGSATILLGGRQSELIPWLKQGSAAIKAQFEEADRLGITLDSTTAKGMEHAGTEIKKLGLMMRGFGIAVTEAVLPAIDQIVPKAMDGVAAFQQWSTASKTAAVKTAAFAGGGLLAIGVIGKLTAAFPPLTAALAIGVAAWTGNAIAVEWMRTKIANLGQEIRDQGPEVSAWVTGWQKTLVFFEAFRQASKLGFLDLVEFKRVYAELLELPAQYGEELGPSLTEWLAAQQFEEDSARVRAEFDEMMAKIADVGDEALSFEEKYAGLLGTLSVEPPATSWLDEFLDKLRQSARYMGDVASGVRSVTSEVSGGFSSGLQKGYTFADELVTKLREFDEWAQQNMFGALVNNMEDAFADMAPTFAGFFDSLKNAMAGFLRDLLGTFIKQKLAELAATKIAEVGKALMGGPFNPWLLAQIPAIIAAYGAAVAGISRIKSFAESAVVTRGGEMTGSFHAGDVILGPQAMRGLLKGQLAGGGQVTIHQNFYGGAPDAMTLRTENRRLADMLRRQMRRE